MSGKTVKRSVTIFDEGRDGSGAVIAPSILSADFAHLGEELARCRRAKARWIHIDVMDGHFVNNLTFGPALVKSCRKAEPDLFFDAHLMVERPMDFAEAFHDAGVQLLTIHSEVSPNPVRDLKTLKRMGLLAGISIKPGTPVRAIKECLAVADLILVMTVEPGFGGQSMILPSLNKVRELDLMRRAEKFSYRLQVDGGVNKETAHMAAAAGADVLVAGSAVFGGGRKVADNLTLLRESMGRVAQRTPLPPAPRKAVAAKR